MGCGVCGSAEVIASPTNVVTFKLRSILSEVNHFPLLLPEETKIVGDYLSAHTLLPPLELILELEKDPARPPFLLTRFERIVWKCFIFNGHCPYEANLFSENIQPQSERQKTSFDQAELDVERTYPACQYINRSQLYLVLNNISAYFPGVGYTQGMNFYIGFLLQCGFGPEECFWIFIAMAQDINFLIIRHFGNNFQSVTMLNRVFEAKLKKSEKELSEKLESMGITSHLYSFSWFLCCFLYSLNPESCVLIWDTFIKQQQISGLIGVALQVMRTIKSQIMECTQSDHVLQILRVQNIKRKFTVSETKKVVEKYEAYPKIQMKELEKLDDEFRKLRNSEGRLNQFLGGTKNEARRKPDGTNP